MANLQALKVEFGATFPFGVCMVGGVEKQNDFERSSKDNPVQARDKETGLPVWVVEVIDFDPQARTKTYKVKVVAEVQPVPPAALADAPIRPVVLENLTVTPYIADGQRPKIAYSLRCTGLAAPVPAGRPSPARRPDHGRVESAGSAGPLGDVGRAAAVGRRFGDR